MIEGFKLLRTYNFAHEAHLDFAKLSDEGIDVQIMDEQISAVYPGISYAVGMKLIVPEADFDKAKEILDTNESDSLNQANLN